MSDARERELERRAAAGDLEAARALEVERERRGAASLAVLSDVHGNLEALDAVLADLDARGIVDVICLGGLTTYGPDPIAVLDRLRERELVCLRGSYDAAVQGEFPLSLNYRLQESIAWTRAKLQPGFLARRATKERWGWYCSLPERHDRPGLIAVHGRPDSPLRYTLPDAPYVEGQDYFRHVQGLAFGGAVGFPCLTTEHARHLRGQALAEGYTVGGEKVAVCPGSVGQPRDRDPRASYAILSEGHVEWVRLDYDLERTLRKVEESDHPHRRRIFERLRMGI